MEERLSKLSLSENGHPPPQKQPKPKVNKLNKVNTAEYAVAAGPSHEPAKSSRRDAAIKAANQKSNKPLQKPESTIPKIKILQRPMKSDKSKTPPNKQPKPPKNGFLKKEQGVTLDPVAGPSNGTPVNAPVVLDGEILKAQQQAKAALKEARLREKIARRRAETDLRAYLQNPRMTPGALLSQNPNDRFIKSLIMTFISHLEKRFASNPDILYTDLADKRHEDYAFFDERLVSVINLLSFTEKTKTHFQEVIEYYKNLHPPSIWKFRKRLLYIKEQVIEAQRQAYRQPALQSTQEDDDLDFLMVTYKQVDAVDLHNQICSLPHSEKLKYFIQQIGLSDEGFQNLNRFVTALRTAFDNSPLAELKIKVHPFGSLSNGLGTFDSDLDIVLQFNKVLSTEDRLDYETCLQILKIIKMILPLKIDVCRRMSRNVIVPSKRCPIIKLDFKDCFKDRKLEKKDNCNNIISGSLAFNKCDISVTSTYGIHNSRMLKFLTLYDHRFYEMALLLKYWAKKNGLICTEGFSSYAFMMLIIYFLQTRQPKILPPLGLLQQLAKDHPDKFYPITVHGWQFGFADDIALIREAMGESENMQTTEQLIPEFFSFYSCFDYFKMAISTRLGVPISKQALFAVKKQQGLEMAFKLTMIVIEDPFVLEHNPGSIFHEPYMPKWLGTIGKLLDQWNVNEGNVVDLLTDPTCWDPNPPPKKEDNKEAKKAAKGDKIKERKDKKKKPLPEQNANNIQNPITNEN